jgi:hypothetical protein
VCHTVTYRWASESLAGGGTGHLYHPCPAIRTRLCKRPPLLPRLTHSPASRTRPPLLPRLPCAPSAHPSPLPAAVTRRPPLSRHWLCVRLGILPQAPASLPGVKRLLNPKPLTLSASSRPPPAGARRAVRHPLRRRQPGHHRPRPGAPGAGLPVPQQGGERPFNFTGWGAAECSRGLSR